MLFPEASSNGSCYERARAKAVSALARGYGDGPSHIVAVRLGVIDALDESEMTAQEIAAELGTDPGATGKLLNALTAMGYLRLMGDRYSLAPQARKWLVQSSPTSLRDFILEQELIEWKAPDQLEAFVRSGTALDLHNALEDEHWALYQRGMRNVRRYGPQRDLRPAPCLAAPCRAP
jgi:Dimerisation domain